MTNALYPTTLPPWMREQLTEEERKKHDELAQIPLHIPAPMTKEQVAEESDIIEYEYEKTNFIEIDI